MLWTAFTLGLFGSLHCVGMCGPLALALPLSARERWTLVGQLLRFNGGRILTYLLLGAAVGALGAGLSLAGYQAHLSIGAGVVLLVLVIFSLSVERLLLRLPGWGRYVGAVRARMQVMLARPGGAGLWRLGMLNGLLPCGLVYLAIVGAATTGSLPAGGIYMLLFGFGTLPLLLASTYLGIRVGGRFRQRLYRLYPVLLGGVGCLLIYRGLRFDLPAGVSLWELMHTAVMCHG